MLAIPAAIIYTVFDGQTNPLIPLFAIGVFLAFTLAQSGLVVHWWRTKPAKWRHRAAINGLGVILSPEDAPGALPGLNGACFQIGAGLGIALVAPVVASGTYAGYQKAMWISTAIVILALLASLWVRGAAGHHEEKI